MAQSYDRFYDDVYAVLSRWEFFILGTQALLLWERVVPSFIFNLMVHLVFWAIALTDLSSLFIVCVCLTIYMLLDLSRNLVLRLLHDSIKSPGSFSEFITLSVRNGHILSVEELSRWTARILHYIMSILNRLAPCRRDRPILFFLITSSTSLLCIWIGTCLPGLLISYALLNVCLVAPLLLYHRVFPRIWHTIKPVLQHIEAEFDRNPLEPMNERLAGEAELYEPIIAAAKASHPELLSSDNNEGFLSDEFLFPPSRRRKSNGEDLDTSEAVFIKQFVPEMSNEEIDKLFSDVLDGANTREAASAVEDNVPPSMPTLPTVKASKIPDPPNLWLMSDEYATDDDDVEDLSSEVDDDTFSVATSSASAMDDFVVVPKRN